jgi:uncharacterized phage-like protein YoqJ
MEIIALTGHRPHKLNNEYDGGKLSDNIARLLAQIINKHKPERCISGMALGADTIWAKVVLGLGIPLTAAIPCLNQDKMWHKSSKDTYKEILSNPLTTTHYVTNKPYSNSCMQERNIWMVDNCTRLIAVWDGSSGGTENSIGYADGKVPIDYIKLFKPMP